MYKVCLKCGQEGHTSSSCTKQRGRVAIVGVVRKFGRVFFKCLTLSYVFIYLTPNQLARRA